MRPVKAPTARKVKAASGTALVTAFIVALILRAFPAAGAVADTLTALVTAVVTAAFTFVVGWLVKHSPDDQAAAASQHYDPDA